MALTSWAKVVGQPAELLGRSREGHVSRMRGGGRRWLFTFALLAFVLVIGCARPGGAHKPGMRAGKLADDHGATREGVSQVVAASNLPASMADDRGATPEGVGQVVAANNEFACKLYTQLRGASGNIFFSPFSISTALAMTYEGARGMTAEEMRSVLGLPEDSVMRRSAFARIFNQLNTGDTAYELNIADALWAQKDYQLNSSYLDVTSRYYSGRATNLDFRHATEESRLTINRWVAEQTRDKIKDLLSKGAIDTLTRLVLTNAIYFKGRWTNEFDKKYTKDTIFRIRPDSGMRVPMMTRRARLPYAEVNGVQILEMPYRNGPDKTGSQTGKPGSRPAPPCSGDISMLVLLPRTDDLRSLEDSLTIHNLTEWREQLRDERVDLYLPRFRVEQKVGLRMALTALGMVSAFDTLAADFSGMRDNDSLCIGDVIHKAIVETDEQGTVAVAATAVTLKLATGKAPPRPKLFRADHPFIFIIQERESGNILFIGRVVNPALGN
jgi:serpin B